MNINEKNGSDFEKHIVLKLNMVKEDKNKNERFSLIDWAGDKYVDGVYAESNTEPDLKLSFSFYGKKFLLAVECKWQKSFYGKDGVEFTGYQLRNYKNYQQRTQQDTFIVLGVGEPAHNPPQIYVIPLNDLSATRNRLTRQQLAHYRQPTDGDFYYSRKQRSLTIRPSSQSAPAVAPAPDPAISLETNDIKTLPWWNKTAARASVGAVIVATIALGFWHSLAVETLEPEPMPHNKIYISADAAAQSALRKTPDLNWQHIAEIYAPLKSIEDWRKLHPAKHWRDGYSAKELASAWINTNPNLPNEIAALFAGPATLLIATPEYVTPLPGGRAGSQSDVLAFVETKNKVCAVAVEGKVNETFGPTVGEWLVNASAGKIKRLQFIADKLGLSYPPADHIRYQLLHRTAAAVIEAENFNVDCAAMIVYSFSQEKRGFDDFAAFLKLLGIDAAQPGKLYSSKGYNSKGATIPLSLGWATAL